MFLVTFQSMRFNPCFSADVGSGGEIIQSGLSPSERGMRMSIARYGTGLPSLSKDIMQLISSPTNPENKS